MATNLENLTALVSEHRRENGRGQYPVTVWESVSALRKQHTVEEISLATGIHATLIYKQTSTKRPKAMFREVKLVPPATVLKPVVVELRRGDGAELRFKIEASTQELSGFFLEFLR
jgi:hypothetical protein